MIKLKTSKEDGYDQAGKGRIDEQGFGRNTRDRFDDGLQLWPT